MSPSFPKGTLFVVSRRLASQLEVLAVFGGYQEACLAADNAYELDEKVFCVEVSPFSPNKLPAFDASVGTFFSSDPCYVVLAQNV